MIAWLLWIAWGLLVSVQVFLTVAGIGMLLERKR